MATQTHFTPRTLKPVEDPDKDVQALFAVQPNRKAIIFIHGFSGDAITTWSDFHLLLLECPQCAGHDIYFYGYDALYADFYASAAFFRGFLKRLFTQTSQIVNGNLPVMSQRAIGFAYDEVVIVAHSLGAAIARRALLDVTADGAAWAPKTKLVLFAPAHKGARVMDLASGLTSLPFVGKFMESATVGARFASPLLDQLKKDSEVLKELLQDTVNARQGGANPHLRAKKVVIAQHERIVENVRFADDPSPDAIAVTDHQSVCKPRHNFRQALKHLEECL